jgi:uncharacterized membrane protein YeiB
MIARMGLQNYIQLQSEAMWLANYVLIDGKMRTLFSMLFGASMLLVIERAEASGRSPAKVHYARMVVLLGSAWSTSTSSGTATSSCSMR